MIKVLRQNEEEVHLILKNAKGVKDVYHILGEYPFFVILQAENNVLLYNCINKIKSISSVTAVWHLLVSYEDLPMSGEIDFEADRSDLFEYSQGNILAPGNEHS
jgi:hypothetical protein